MCLIISRLRFRPASAMTRKGLGQSHGLKQHAYLLSHSSGPEPTAGRQLRHIVYANHASKCSRRTAAVLAPASSRNAALFAATYTPVFAHITSEALPETLPVASSFKTRARVCAHHTCAAAGCAVCAAQPPIGQLLQPAAPSAQPFRQRRPLRAKPQEAGLCRPACTLPSCRQGSSQLLPQGLGFRV